MVGVAASTVRWMAGPERGVVVRDDKVYRSSPRMPVSQHPLVHPSPRDSGELYPFSGQDDALRQGDARDRVDDRIPFDGELEHLLVGQWSAGSDARLCNEGVHAEIGVGAAAVTVWALGSAGVERQVPYQAEAGARTRDQTIVRHETAADPDPDRQDGEILVLPSVAEPVLCFDQGVDVVRDGDRNVELVSEQRCKVDLGPVQERRRGQARRSPASGG